MRFHAFAADYDGTLATHGKVGEETIDALRALRETGRRLLLVTGRELNDLQSVFPHTELFDRVVAENGAVVYNPETREVQLLAAQPHREFVAALRFKNVAPLSVGHVIVATWQPMQTIVMETIRELGLELQIIFNKGAVMVLPTGINKASGLKAALDQLSISPHNVLAVGDAENDHAFLELCECSVAVDNAVPMLKEKADYTTAKDHGAGVQELIAALMKNELADLRVNLKRHDLAVGRSTNNQEVYIPAYGVNVLVAGTSGGGKTTLATSFIETLKQAGYQFCVVDPEGDYTELPGITMFGDPQLSPNATEAIQLLQRPDQNGVINLLALSFEDRPPFFQAFFPSIQELRVSLGHPHWLIIDEVHHLMPASWQHASMLLPRESHGLFMITVRPDNLADTVLSVVDIILAVGDTALSVLENLAAKVQRDVDLTSLRQPQRGEAVYWDVQNNTPPVLLRLNPPQAELKRHVRKYAEGELGEDASFYFRGRDGKLNLRAQNLTLFLQLADGVDDDTWQFHLQNGDYSRWFEEKIKDSHLAEQARDIERQQLSPKDTRARIRALIEERYTAPA